MYQGLGVRQYSQLNLGEFFLFPFYIGELSDKLQSSESDLHSNSGDSHQVFD